LKQVHLGHLLVRQTLEAYEGTLVIAAHDRFLLDRLCTVIWVIERGTVRVFEGNYSESVGELSTPDTV
jgi:ATPase subunit of ABC transporter with duplicated ATPase domains